MVAEFDAQLKAACPQGIDIYSTDTFGNRWIAMNILSVAAIICLPRQFQVTVVENSDENHLRTASWAFPIYMLLMSLFILPIPVPIPAPLFAVGYVAWSWWSARQARGRVNHDAHLGGALFGLLFVALTEPAAFAGLARFLGG